MTMKKTRRTPRQSRSSYKPKGHAYERGKEEVIRNRHPARRKEEVAEASAIAQTRKRGCDQQALPEDNKVNAYCSLGYASPLHRGEHTKPEEVCRIL